MTAADQQDEDEGIGSEVTDEASSEAPTKTAPEVGERADHRDVLDKLDLTRGEIDANDLKGLMDAVDAIDFAARRASEADLASLRSLHARLGDVIEQIARGERSALPEQEPLTPEQEARYEALIDQGLEAGRGRDLKSAQSSLEEAVRLNPEGIDGLFNLGVVYGLIAHHNITKAEFYDDYTQDEIYLEKARLCYDHVLDLDPLHMPSLNNLATLYSMRDDRESAITYLERIVSAEPRSDVERHLAADARVQLAELR